MGILLIIFLSIEKDLYNIIKFYQKIWLDTFSNSHVTNLKLYFPGQSIIIIILFLLLHYSVPITFQNYKIFQIFPFENTSKLHDPFSRDSSIMNENRSKRNTKKKRSERRDYKLIIVEQKEKSSKNPIREFHERRRKTSNLFVSRQVYRTINGSSVRLFR